jgi:putative endonuclease
MFYTYVLQSIGNLTYTYKGFCKNLHQRLKEHNTGKTKSNKHYAPFRIIYYESFDTIAGALKNEKYWKTAAGRRYLQKILINGPVVQWIE